MTIAGLFSGIGGLELPFGKHETTTELLCDVWDASRAVLGCRFRGVPLYGDVARLKSLPNRVDVVTAGFPCTDLSQAGRTAGISGDESGLVQHVFRLVRNRRVRWLVLENVRNMLVLDGGRAMRYLTSELEDLGFRWAYRLVDSRFTGVPQRRHRVLFVASRDNDPREVLFADDAGEPKARRLHDDAFGFYWTEGYTGLGWAQDSVPPLKGGSRVGIPSPPAIWMPRADPGMKIVTPPIEDAEALQGFERGWTEPAETTRRNGPRWKLVGNAVTVPVAAWLVDRICEPGETIVESVGSPTLQRWPNAAYGEKGKLWEFRASTWPVRRKYRHLTDLLSSDRLTPLSHRATSGFLARARRSTLNFDVAFIRDVEEHISLANRDRTMSLAFTA